MLKLVRRSRSPRCRQRVTMQTPLDVVRHVGRLAFLEQESVCVLGLNSQHEVISEETVALGTVNEVRVTHRDVFRELVRQNCTCFILVHNHPSGKPSPSPEDKALTKAITESGELLGISILDHVIVASNGHFSFQAAGEMEPGGNSDG